MSVNTKHCNFQNMLAYIIRILERHLKELEWWKDNILIIETGDFIWGGWPEPIWNVIVAMCLKIVGIGSIKCV